MEKNLKMNLSLMSTFLYFYQRRERNPWLTPVTAPDEGGKESRKISAAQTFPFWRGGDDL